MNINDTELTTIRQELKNEQRKLLIRRFLSNKLAVTGLFLIMLITILVLIAPLMTNYSPYEMDEQHRLEAPSSTHLLGTDNFGRDLLSRTVYGGRVSLKVGFIVAFFTTIIGMAIGLYASYYRLLDQIFMRICDAIMSFPAILLAMSLVAAFGPSTMNIIIALSIVYTPYVARIVRSSALVIREETYIEAMKAQGANSFRIIWGHIAPNTLSPLIIQSTFIFTQAIIVEAALSFLGVGVPAPDPSWGNILYDGKLVISIAWWMVVFPGISLVLSVLGLNLFGDGLRDILDPHTKK